MRAQVGVCAPRKSLMQRHPFCGLVFFSVMHVFPFVWVSSACLHIKCLHLFLDGCDLFNTQLLLCEILLFVAASLPKVTISTSLWVGGILKTIATRFPAGSVRLL